MAGLCPQLASVCRGWRLDRLGVYMEAATRIREAVDRVRILRESASARPELGNAVVRVKAFQARRFAATYADLLESGPYVSAARFFLEELYSERDYAERDAQFGKIAGAIQRFFPAQVAETATALAELHALTEDLDHAMAQAWLAAEATRCGADEVAIYVTAWRTISRQTDRDGQLSVVLRIGHEMVGLTRTPGLRLMLRMMRAPASAAGLGSLQRFLELGFDTFADLARNRQNAEAFLEVIARREAALIRLLFDATFVACETTLRETLGVAR